MNKSLGFKLVFKAVLFTLATLLGFWLLNSVLSGKVWEGMTLSKSALVGEYCEFNNSQKFFHQSMNTYSNLAYFFFGILIIFIAIYDIENTRNNLKNKLEKFPQLSILMGLFLIYLSIGSAFFHASLTYVGQRVDMNGTYSISIALLGIAFYHLFQIDSFTENGKKIWVIALIIMTVIFIPIHLLISSSILLPGMILLQTVLVFIIYFRNRQERFFLLAISSIILMFIAVKIRTLDVQKIGCDPHSFYQGHAIWHLLTALSSFFSYAFFRFSKIQP
ncbi:hypothetical protein EGI22_08630 [Lacihabitans sp. LS3-19]|uniref:ceramidase domain-containing protein n=1 Tax=Lacihabitans sp. LS3-19 TaxID=2487335 RepID=UPI0020CC9571|nr:ceramidase domain-containing protein [Lacihabitans sp. LS3-19]MCP9767976.1 hypothetical protein [Lacihabitans sp. LS3-19]